MPMLQEDEERAWSDAVDVLENEREEAEEEEADAAYGLDADEEAVIDDLDYPDYNGAAGTGAMHHRHHRDNKGRFTNGAASTGHCKRDMYNTKQMSVAELVNLENRLAFDREVVQLELLKRAKGKYGAAGTAGAATKGTAATAGAATKGAAATAAAATKGAAATAGATKGAAATAGHAHAHRHKPASPSRYRRQVGTCVLVIRVQVNFHFFFCNFVYVTGNGHNARAERDAMLQATQNAHRLAVTRGSATTEALCSNPSASR